ncbi:transcriptional regulation of mitochondrial recombination-domain-containing protein, partial [Pseudomassariella vexata]
GHGEKIWVFNHFVRGMTVYGHEPVMKSNRALKQIPFNGKKLKPAKLRKDYWRPMAMIQFPEGMGHVGRSVYHLMREFRMAHELSWDDEMLRDDATGRTLTKHERGAKLNDQKPNSIADMAAVLGGAGKGNKIWMTVAEGGDNVETKALNLTDGETGAALGLVKATIFWSDAMDRNYALEWPPNVSHAEFAGST